MSDDLTTRRGRYVGDARKDPRYGSCICAAPGRIRANGGKLVIDPACGYHQVAADFPNDHSIPWNCPTYWDGCNCDDPAFARAPEQKGDE